ETTRRSLLERVSRRRTPGHRLAFHGVHITGVFSCTFPATASGLWQVYWIPQLIAVCRRGKLDTEVSISTCPWQQPFRLLSWDRVKALPSWTIPSNVVVDQWASDGESNSPCAVLLVPDMCPTADRLGGDKIPLALSKAVVGTTPSSGLCLLQLS